jgi:hypothetical protein
MRFFVPDAASTNVFWKVDFELKPLFVLGEFFTLELLYYEPTGRSLAL